MKAPHDHRITLEQARALVQNYRKHAPPNSERCGMFHRAIIDEILAQPGCAGIRVYRGRHEKGADALVLVGVTADGADLTDGVLADEHKPCPPDCDPDSPLGT
jgi:hypothetical protein